MMIKHVWQHDLGKGENSVVSIANDKDAIKLMLAQPTPDGSYELTLLLEWITAVTVVSSV